MRFFSSSNCHPARRLLRISQSPGMITGISSALRGIGGSSSVSGFAAPALLSSDGTHLDGLTLAALHAFAQSADLLINISGHLTLPAIRDLPRCKVFIDEDPGFTQFWYKEGLARPSVDGHDAYYTLGRNTANAIARSRRAVSTRGSLRTPIVLAIGR